MKRYLLFSGKHYDPLGGWNDFDGSFDSLDEAKAGFVSPAEWAHIIDVVTGDRLEWQFAIPSGDLKRPARWSTILLESAKAQ